MKRHPVRAVGMGGRQVDSEPEYGHIYDHFASTTSTPTASTCMSMCRQIEGCESNVSETIVGTKGQCAQQRLPRSTAGDQDPGRAERRQPLRAGAHRPDRGIRSSKPINELKQVAESTLTAIMGRMSAYTGKAVPWEQALNSKLDTFPQNLAMDNPMPEPPFPSRASRS